METKDEASPVEGMVRHDDPDPHDEHERQLIEIIAMIRSDYERAARPYIERLARLREARQPPRITISVEQASSLGLLPNAQHEP